MKDLIERLEKADGPDRELDCAIYERLGAKAPSDGSQYWDSPDGRTRHYEALIPRYTASLDAALTLVPEGWCWRYDSSTFDAEVSDFRGRFLIDADEEWHGANKNPAIAISIAALRARMSVAKEAGR